jgi:hypothetical protein
MGKQLDFREESMQRLGRMVAAAINAHQTGTTYATAYKHLDGIEVPTFITEDAWNLARKMAQYREDRIMGRIK